MKYFTVGRSDNCIWLTDKREENPHPIHLTPPQAQEVGKALLNISFEDLSHNGVSGRIE